MLFQIKNLSKSYQNDNTVFERSQNDTIALNNISFTIYNSERLAIIGETGSGKSTLGKCLIRLIRPTAGSIIFENRDLLKLSRNEFRLYQKKFQMIFQNPTQSLNPMQSIKSALSEPLKMISGYKGSELNNQLLRLLELVQLENEIKYYYPHELSGGQKQRISIARALAVNPLFLIADEPTSYLDAPLKTAIIELINHLWKQFGLTLLLISHDLNMVSRISDRIAVLYKGNLIEISQTKKLLENPLHPYTKHLIGSSKIKNMNLQQKQLGKYGTGCPYVNNCNWAEKQCSVENPTLCSVSENHSVACPVVWRAVKQ